MTRKEDRCAVCGRPDGYRGWSLLRLRRFDGLGTLNFHEGHRLISIIKAGYWVEIVFT